MVRRGFPSVGPAWEGFPVAASQGSQMAFWKVLFFSQNPLGFTVEAVGSDSVIFNTSREGR